MYYTGIDPFTLEKVYTPRSYEEKRMQRALLQYSRRENEPFVRKAIEMTGRRDANILLGYAKPNGTKKNAKDNVRDKHRTDVKSGVRNAKKTDSRAKPGKSREFVPKGKDSAKQKGKRRGK